MLWQLGLVLNSYYKKIISRCVFTLLLASTFALLFHKIWIKYISLYHVFLEGTCIFISLLIFFTIWCTFNHEPSNDYILGLGYLSAAFFDILHTIYAFNGPNTPGSEMASRFWILGRFATAIAILLYVNKKSLIRYNKYIALVILISLIATGSFFAIVYSNKPVLLNEYGGVTPVKTILEILIIITYVYNFITIKNKLLDKRHKISLENIIIAIFLNIPSEICFAIYNSITSPFWTIGHIIKITAYFFLCKGVFIHAITYPYMYLDIERKKLKRNNSVLEAMSSTLNNILDSFPIALLIFDENGQVKYVNKRFEDLLGCGRNMLYGLSASDVDDILKHDGKQTYTALNGQTLKLLRESHGIGSETIIFFNETKKQQELDNLHIQTETILNSVNNTILMIDNDNKIILCNKALENFIGKSKEEIIGNNIWSLFNQIEVVGQEESIVTDLYDIKSNPHNKSYELSLMIGGVKKHVIIYITSIKNIDSDVIGRIIVGTDITELKASHERMLHQEKLALLGQLGAGIVHETRNYLTTIKGRSQLIFSLTNDVKIKNHTLKLNNDIDEINNIISQFLFLSKPSKPELKEVSLEDVFESIKTMITSSSLIRGIDVEINISKENKYILCDEINLKQIILNLCKNAVDVLSGNDHAKIIIETGYNKMTNEMYIKISDNGRGIPEEDLKKIGTPFFTTKKNGTGLGLSTCYKIIREHNGRIEVASKLGKGTTFTVILPCIEEHKDHDDNEDQVIPEDNQENVLIYDKLHNY